jgi:hypothetical protein
VSILNEAPGAFLSQVQEIFSYQTHTILKNKIIVFTFEGKAKNTMVEIK